MPTTVRIGAVTYDVECPQADEALSLLRMHTAQLLAIRQAIADLAEGQPSGPKVVFTVGPVREQPREP